MGLGHDVEQAFLVGVVQALLVVRAAAGMDVFAYEHTALIDGPGVPYHMPESHPAVQAGEAKNPAGYWYLQEGRGHVTWYPQRPPWSVPCPLPVGCGARVGRGGVAS